MLPSTLELTIIVGMHWSNDRRHPFVAAGLRRLHFASNLQFPRHAKFVSTLCHFAPNLTHLRFSDVQYLSGYGDLTKCLTRAVELWNQRANPENDVDHWLANLQLVVIYQSTHSVFHSRLELIHVDGHNAEDAYFFDELAEHDSSGKLIVIISKYRTDQRLLDPNIPEDIRDVYWEWLDRCRGGSGNWDVGGRSEDLESYYDVPPGSGHLSSAIRMFGMTDLAIPDYSISS